MAVAVRTDSSLSPTVTQANLIVALVTAFTNAGYSTPLDNYTSGTDRILVYQFDTDNTKLLGTNILRIRVTNTLQILSLLGTSYNSTTKAIANSGTEHALGTLATNLNITFISLNAGNEAKFIFITQGATFIPLGVLIPANRPGWWNLDTWSYAFIFTAAAMTTLNSSSSTPYANQVYDILSSTRLGSVNTQVNRRDVLTGLVLLTQNNTGIAGKTSDDLAIAAGIGSTRFDLLSFPGTTQQFLLAVNAAAGFAIRTQ